MSEITITNGYMNGNVEKTSDIIYTTSMNLSCFSDYINISNYYGWCQVSLYSNTGSFDDVEITVYINGEEVPYSTYYEVTDNMSIEFVLTPIE